MLQELDSQIDHLREDLRLATLLGDASNAHLEAEMARARRNESATRSQIWTREKERAEAAQLIPSAFLTHYERLRERHKTRPWVVSLSSASCPACNIMLPSKLLSDAQRGAEPVACPSCARLLIWRLP